jgi:hypothetical protein
VPEALAEPEAQAEFELEPQAEVEADNQAEAQALVPEALAEAEAQAELDAQTEPEPALAAEPALAFESEPLDEVVPVAAQQAVVEATSTDVEAVAETLALDQRPIELVFADEETAAESEPETTWDWSFVSETEAEPIEASEPDGEPIAASAEEESADAGALVDAPHVPAQPQSLPPPVLSTSAASGSDRAATSARCHEPAADH